MAQASDIRPHMEVLGSDGVHIGTVDHVEGDRIKLTRSDSNDGEHHYLPLSDVTRVDAHVHVATTAAAMGLLAVAGTTGFTADHGAAPFPPVKNRQVEGARPRGNYYLPWIVALIGLLLLFLLFRSCVPHEQATTTTTTTATTTAAVPDPAAQAPVTNMAATAPAVAPLPVEAVKLPGGRTMDLAPNSLNYVLQRYLASDQPTPRTFVFDELNFATDSSTIRPQDRANVDALADILQAYPNARVTVTGYTDARGTKPYNARLGTDRAQSVASALTAKGVDKDRITTATGGESKPQEPNASADGRHDNRRSELTVTAK